jgi:Kef-type K+ transport system membrane component KefB
LISV